MRLSLLLTPTCELLLFYAGKPLQPIPMGEKPGLPPFVAALLDQVVVLGGFPLPGLVTPVFPWDSLFHYDHFPSPIGPNDYVWPHGCLDSGVIVVSFPGSASSSRIEWSAGGF